jgi:hypothetical protein
MGTRTRAKSSPVVLENIVDTGTEGTRVATGTEAQRGTTEGQLRYNTEIDGLEVRNASAHVVVKSQTDVLAWTTAAGSLLSGHSVGSAITNINLAAESATGGAVTYAVQSGSLTAGLSMSTGGVISGTPTGVGTANFTVRATTGSNTSDRAFTINTIQSAYTAEIMVVGGGGSGGYTTGGWVGGGGGSGGIAYHSGQTINPATDYAVVIGAGGSEATSPNEGGANVSDNGSNSTGFSMTGYGGGGGAGYSNGYTHGSAGGSSGGCEGGQHGGTHQVTPTQGTGGTAHYGSANGGDGAGGPNYYAGGGGGTGEQGSTDGYSTGGDGTAAFNTWLAATSTGVDSGGTRYIAGGGSAGVPSGSQRDAGLGGGGQGGDNQGSSGAAGTANTGGGGGGRGKYNLGSGTGGAGGSGLVIVRYSGTQVGGATGGTVVTTGGYTYHTFTSSGTFRSST